MGKVGASPGVPGVLDQRTLDSFGIILHQEVLATHARTRVGHHGLFFDNLTAPTATTMLPGSATLAVPNDSTRGVYLTHNRVYDPRLGRFLQHDPNASGSPNFDSLGSTGSGLLAPKLSLDLESRLADGGNLYSAYAASPVMNSDPTGLFILGAVSAVVPGPSDLVRGALRGLVEDYAANLDFDVEWALDLPMPDDWHSRLDNTWIALALARGVNNAFDFEIPFTDLSFNPLDWFATRSGGGSGGARSARGSGVHPGLHIAAARGQQAHRNYRHSLGSGYKLEFSIKGHGARVDAIDCSERIVRELKPDTPSGLARGARQMKRCIDALSRAYPEPPPWTGYLDTYTP